MPSPEAVGEIKPKHVRVLQHRYHHLLGKIAQYESSHPGLQAHYDRAEAGALQIAIATLNELIDARDG